MDRSALVPEQIDAVVFDVIGTLVDEDGTWQAVAERLAAEAGVDDGAALYTVWAEILEQQMNAVVDGTAPSRPHRQLVNDSAREAITRSGGNPAPAALALVQDLDSEYPAWPDVAPATAALRKNHLVAGVSNGDLDSLARLANTNAISWDVALSTGSAGTFKPAPAAYEYAIDALRLDPARTLFVAAHPWDLRAASEHGFRTAYVARPGAERPSADDSFDLYAEDLAALVELLS
ncbi:HAD-IA family hydrolase [Mycobacterium hodleri]|uniref:HAD-IA family hydrolase n=1 Tax=Mycolicibacterium hodleri TaxID=49897 RepID=UPI0021F388C5|nr:HAD-IA family hydrolase [Mycolicibacterium hodleri]MCV7136726.1 HAD-IA family hydrolase [Mycolicibacterium hodleri]